MRGLTASLAYLCLALASGTPVDEQNKIDVKNYDFGKNEVIYSVNNINKDELLYAVCEGNDPDKKCKVYLESTDQNENTVRSCDVKLNYMKPYWNTLELQNTGYNKIIFVVRDGKQAKLIIVNMSSCQVKEATVDLSEIEDHKFPYPPRVAIVPHENNFDVVFNNRKLCQSPLCKATLDYDGNVVKDVSGFGMKDLIDGNFFIEIDNGHLFKLYNDTQSKVYLIRNGELDDTPLFVQGQPDTIATATDENKIGFCNYDKNKIACKQYDAEGKNKIFEADGALGDNQIIVPRNFDMLNLEKGMLTVMIAVTKVDENLDRQVLAVPFDENGKQLKVINVGLKIEMDGTYYLNLYKNKLGEPCVLGIFLYYNSKTDDSSSNTFKFSRSTKCFAKNELV